MTNRVEIEFFEAAAAARSTLTFAAVICCLFVDFFLLISTLGQSQCSAQCDFHLGNYH